jgi:peptidyl-prolyl cis-trans isomerase D
MKSFRSKRSTMFGYALLALVIVGLAGFGLGGTVTGLTSANVATVGDRTVSSRDYARAFQSALQRQSQQLGVQLTPDQARMLGLDQQVLGQMVASAALDDQADRLGLSVDDAILRDAILKEPGFQGPDGKFSETAYRLWLDNAGLDATEFETALRRDLTRALLQSSVAGAIRIPDTLALSMLKHLREERAIDYIRLEPALIDQATLVPSDADLRAEYDANPGSYTLPETRVVDFAALLPADLAATLAIPEADIRAAYDADPARFAVPERRAVDRIVFETATLASTARQRILAGTDSFDDIAADMGLSPDQIDQGDLSRDDLGPAADGVFAVTEPGALTDVVTTDRGPAIFRINAVLAATDIPYDEARAGLRDEIAATRAADQVLASAEAASDLVAGGGTLDDLVTELGFAKGEARISDDSAEGSGPAIMSDPAFLAEVAEATAGEERDVFDLDDGGLAVVRLREIVPPTLQPFDAVRDQVVANWKKARTQALLLERAEALRARLPGETLQALAAETGTTVQTATGLMRGGADPNLPPAALSATFDGAAGDSFATGAGDAVILGRIAAITPFDPAAGDNAAMLSSATANVGVQVADDLFNAYTAAVQDGTDVSIDQGLINRMFPAQN